MDPSIRPPMYEITIITLTYNSSSYLNECLQSVLNSILLFTRQFPSLPIQHLVVDGNSSDSTKTICSKYDNVNFCISPSKGLYPSLDYAVSIADSKYIIYVHSDDYISIGFILHLYLSLSSDKTRIPAADVCFVDSSSNHLWSRYQPPIIPFFQRYTNLIVHPNCIYRSECERLFPYYSATERASLDWDHINSLINSGYHFERVPAREVKYFMRLHHLTTTSLSNRAFSNNTHFLVLARNLPSTVLTVLAKLYLFTFETNKIKRVLLFLIGKRNYR